MASCDPGECGDDPKYTTPVKVKPYPNDGGGGHEFVTELPLPDDAKVGVEYVLMDDLSDPSTYKGTYILNPETNAFIASSSGGGGGGVVDTAMSDSSTNAVQNKVIKQYVDDTKSDVESLLEKKVFVAEYNVTTADEIRSYLDAAEEPFAPILVKRGNDYYTAILATKSGDNAAIVRVIGSGSGEFFLFTYTVTNATWVNSSYGLQKKLVSGTNIKTINNQSLLGEGNIDIGGGGSEDRLFYITVDANAFNPSASDPNVLEMELTSPYTMAELNAILAKTNPESMVLRIISPNGTTKDINDIVLNTMSPNGFEGDLFFTTIYFRATHNYAKFIIKPENGKTMLRMYQGDISAGIIPAYEQSLEDVGGNVIQKGTVDIDGTVYGFYEFFYKTGALPASNSTKVYSFANLLADYTIQNFIDATGITSNGIFIGNGRTDNDNRVIVQQFSKNNKTITLRAYQDYTRETGTLKVQFIGKKNV